MRSTYAVINLSNLKFNFLNIRRKVKDAKVMAVVKADAYGHGACEIAKALNSLGGKKPEYFAVAISEEAIELRKQNIKNPILVFDPFNKVQAELVFKYNLIPTVFSNDHIKILLKAKNNIASKKRIKVHIKVDTGMNRIGIDFNEAFDFVKKISQNKNFIIDGIYTHFATSDEQEKKFANFQLKRFKYLLIELKKNKIGYGLAHAANSGAILDMPDSYFDMVRPGILLYGYYPSAQTSNSIKIKPVMSLYSIVTAVKKITAGETVSYGRKFGAKRETKIASVPIGYADGFSRGLTNSAKAIIKGKLFPQVGTVTMDRIMFEVGEENIHSNDKVILLGKHGNIKIDARDWGNILNTIPYEIVCGISKRVPRIYKS
ncbi:MAG: alanine racemase [Ignavibacteriaceae bacterium]